MTREEKLNTLKMITNENDENILSVYLDIAGEKIINRCYPFRIDIEEVPERYQSLQIEIACYLYNKQGAEGQTSHNENGISRTYESADVPESMLKDVVPFVKVI